MKKIIIIFSLILLNNVFPCSQIYNPPSQFNPEDYIFIGTVVEQISANLENSNSYYPYYGILVEIKEEIYLPQKPKKYFEIFPLSLGPACNELRMDSSFINKYYPIGSTVRIVARNSKIGLIKLDSNNIQLEVSPRNQIIISQNITTYPILNSTKNSTYDYNYTNRNSRKSLLSRIADSLKIIDRSQIDIISISLSSLQDFELRKDLYRLYSSKNENGKIAIIQRLINFKAFGIARLIKVINTYINNEDLRNKLFSTLFQLRSEVNLDRFKHWQ